MKLNAPVVGMAATPTGGGYWEVAADGGVFAFGNATYYGSMGSKHLNDPIVGMAAAPTGHGYWLAASDGGIFAFGSALFHGSKGGQPLNAPVVGIAADPTRQRLAAEVFPLTAGSSTTAAPGSSAPRAVSRSTPRWTTSRPPPQATATPWWPPTAGSSTTAVPGSRLQGRPAPESPPWSACPAPPQARAIAGVHASDGGVFTYGTAAFLGSMGGTTPQRPGGRRGRARRGAPGHWATATRHDGCGRGPWVPLQAVQKTSDRRRAAIGGHRTTTTRANEGSTDASRIEGVEWARRRGSSFRLSVCAVTVLGSVGLLSGVAFGSTAGAAAPAARPKATVPHYAAAPKAKAHQKECRAPSPPRKDREAPHRP